MLHRFTRNRPPTMIESVIGVHLSGALFVSRPVPRLLAAAS